VAAAAQAARERGAKIVPQCSYVRRLFESKPAYADVTAEKV
ncbi:MAG: N-acetyltransferase, partial [Pyramidobacter sp.]|nr:N-acetyltransferase [Pyramidobacter sp.]